MIRRGTEEGKGSDSASQPLRLGSLNVSRCSTNVCKKEEMGRIFVEWNLDILTINEVKIKGKGEQQFGSVTGRLTCQVCGELGIKSEGGSSSITKSESGTSMYDGMEGVIKADGGEAEVRWRDVVCCEWLWAR